MNWSTSYRCFRRRMPSSIWPVMSSRGSRRLGLKLRLSQNVQPPVVDRAIDIGAGEAGVEADFLHPAAKPLAKDEVRGCNSAGRPRARRAFWQDRGQEN